jgi:hypothetical protein
MVRRAGPRALANPVAQPDIALLHWHAAVGKA